MTYLAVKRSTKNILRYVVPTSIVHQLRPISFNNGEFTSTEESYILEKLNSSTPNDLERYAITKSRTQSLIKYRVKHGQFQSLDQILNVEGFGTKNLTLLCSSIVKNEIKSEKQTTTPANQRKFITPSISSKRLQASRTVVGICLGAFSASWAGVDIPDRSLFDWKYLDLQLDPKLNKHNEPQLLEAVHNLHSFIPPADLYIMNVATATSIQVQPLNTVAHIQKIQLTAMLIVLLNMHSVMPDGSWKHKVVFQSSELWCRLFRNKIGGETVSPQNFVSDMIYNKQVGDFYTPLRIGPAWAEQYLAAKPVQKEAFCTALLSTIAFLDLNVFLTPNSLSIINKRRKISKK